MKQSAEHPHQKLNELQATSICGNDISSSCLHVAALTITYAGQYAWISSPGISENKFAGACFLHAWS